MPAALAPFASGNLLVTGQKYDRDPSNQPMWPFTAIFASDGTLLKEIKLDDDDAIHDLTVSSDPRVVSPQNPTSNRAISFSQMLPAEDGDIYLVRWLTPAIVYAVSPGGEVVRRFKIDPGDGDYRPGPVHISGNRMAVLFIQPKTRQKIMKVVDLEGQELASYEEARGDGKTKLGGVGSAFACYSAQPERFTFLRTGENDKLELLIAEPR
jgi:hypothetical protein